ncbi:MAG: YcgN family cysteine cluster protein [Pseudomonadales bacterium]|nr:YcgN family cysteine cluster protein [Pseudomonadales bacterium]MDP6471747.1 YcgN family cysteine cluster protein [Pseudomonadales bacterium]MDP6971421.1 YcgN family cysteine cluster protein [Pseudomonadales bacterium]
MSFWRAKTLAEMSDAEWESLCDGCAQCCLIKLQDDETAQVHYTAIVCDLLDQDACRCTRYPQRHRLVPACIEISADNACQLDRLPASCAYRLIARGEDLPAWHHLLIGSGEEVHEVGVSVRGRVIARQFVHTDDEQNYVVDWVEQ